MGIFVPIYPARPKYCPGAKKCSEWAFGYMESKNEVRLGLAPQNGSLSHLAPETPEPFTSSFRNRDQERVQFKLPKKFGVGRSKFGLRVHVYPEMKGRCFHFYFPGPRGLRRWALDPTSQIRFPCLTSWLVVYALPTRKSTLTGNGHGRSCGCPYTQKKAAPLGVMCQGVKRQQN